ncbi:Uncharacterized protein Adt_23292 [Abeliophyllum distichum]|uniref:Uncharacterized protein n=1 Tax=Abeliophyllum distichum TaxID=126358 RepID=A0ABD1SAG5_9LAMI
MTLAQMFPHMEHTSVQGLVPVDVIIQKRIGVHMVLRCQCCSEIETIQHVFIDSLVAHQVWQHFSTIFGIPLKVGEMLQHRFQTWKFSGQFFKGGHIRTIILLLVLWFIWTARNDAKHHRIGIEPSRIIWRVHHTIFLLYTGKLFQFVHWRGDLDLAPHFGITLISPSPNPLLWFIGVPRRLDLPRSIPMDASRMDLRVAGVLSEITLGVVSGSSLLATET